MSNKRYKTTLIKILWSNMYGRWNAPDQSQLFNSTSSCTSQNIGGRTILVNLALLSRLSHDKFNVIERYKPRTAEEINDELRHYKSI